MDIIFSHFVTETTGFFEWTPQNLEPVHIGIAASDGQAASVLVAEVHVCQCQNSGTCDFDVNAVSNVELSFYVSFCYFLLV